MDEWQQLHEQYAPLVWATVYRILADEAESRDCCQDVFAEVLSRDSATPIRNWPGYLRWLATRRSLDRLRWRRAETARFDSDSEPAELPGSLAGPEDQANWQELIERLRQELARLPQPQAEAFWLYSVEQMTQMEIAEQLGVNANHVGVLVHRARKRLSRQLADLDPTRQHERS